MNYKKKQKTVSFVSNPFWYAERLGKGPGVSVLPLPFLNLPHLIHTGQGAVNNFMGGFYFLDHKTHCPRPDIEQYALIITQLWV